LPGLTIIRFNHKGSATYLLNGNFTMLNLKIETRFQMKSIFLFLFILAGAGCFAQVNLVPNPSFEADTIAPDITKFNWNRYSDWRKDSLKTKAGNELYLAKSWWQPTGGTPDYLNSKNSWLLGFKTKTARTGDGRMALIAGITKKSLVAWAFYKETYAEYIECRLLDTLEAGKTYCVRYYIALDRKSNFANHRFGAALTQDCVQVKNYHSCFWGTDPYAQVIANDDHYVTSGEGWVMICDTFVARGGEKFLTIGCFSGESPKHVHKCKRSEHGGIRVAPFNKFAYYYVDDVSLTEVMPGEALCSPPRDSIARNNVVFLIDVSGSMEAFGLIRKASDAILSFVNTMPENDRISIVTYGGSSEVLAEGIPARDTASIRKALEKIKPGGASNVVSGINLAYESIRKNKFSGGTNKVILLTDGRIYVPKKTKEMIRTAVKEEEIFLSVVFFGEKIPEEVEKFAEEAGGDATIAPNGDAEQALKQQVATTVTDTPYGTGNARKVAVWEFFTKILVPGIITLFILKNLKVI
jgi:hypothetical protein